MKIPTEILVQDFDKIKVLSKIEFYQKLITEIASAEKHVYLMYLRQNPPTEGTRSIARENYFAFLNDFIPNSRVPIDRIVLNSTHNNKWVNDQYFQFQNIKNHSLYLLEEKDFTFHFGIKIIDNNKVFLVYAGNDIVPEKRFFYIESEDIQSICRSIFLGIARKCIRL